MWVDHTLKVPDDGEVYAVVRVTEHGETSIIRYLSPVQDPELVQAILDGAPRTFEATVPVICPRCSRPRTAWGEMPACECDDQNG